uniref:Uncharacterized protein n=1 Tax=Cacopsylla melanoneura TaxID=428564 RepID=A0A8D8VFV7_9HEMI
MLRELGQCFLHNILFASRQFFMLLYDDQAKWKSTKTRISTQGEELGSDTVDFRREGDGKKFTTPGYELVHSGHERRDDRDHFVGFGLNVEVSNLGLWITERVLIYDFLHLV